MMKHKSEDLAAKVIEDFKKYSGNRSNFESHWEEIAQRVMPSQSTLFNSFGNLSTKGNKRTEHLYDSTAAIALNRFGAILDSLLTPRNQTWHRIKADMPELNKDRRVNLWFEEVNRLLFKYRYAPKANFASQNQQNYKSLGAFGTGGMFIDELKGEEGLRYRNIHLSELYVDENHQGIVDKVIRHFALTARQAFQQWGEKLPQKIKDDAFNHPTREYFFLHSVCPREDYDPGRKDHKGMPWVSRYVAVEGSHLLSEGGYKTFPYAISRYEQVPGEVYGRSPSMDVLPAIKTLNEQKKTLLKQGQRAVDPVLLVHDDGILDGFSLRPGAINPGGVDKNGRPLVHTIPTGNIAAGKDMMDDERAVINDAFLVTIFQILAETPQMTATEVMERTREKGVLLAPTLGRQQSEYLGPLIEREIDVLVKQGLLPPMPPALVEAQGEYRIEYDSPMSRAQRAEEASGVMRTIEAAMNVANVTQNMEPLDHFDWDAIIPELADIHAVPAKWRRSMEQIQEIRQGRAQQAQQQQMIQAAPGVAAVTKAAAIAQKG